ncbi:hyccin [Ostrinia furnacalis]|uniref:hyccin n=1 Tax=Ostrinia furnacalis TaxID=93504 RepID=UPI00103C9985|nr:hyccin [Ostrinia furnacalis]XP_028164045.1 hyccin [Ostrinia furnacalis]XP_028164046.1 hyccin [Ostrinia furnacalis]
MAEWKQLINEWIAEYTSLQENEIKSFAAEHEHNHEIATALFNLFYSEDECDINCSNKNQNESPEEILENVCTQLFSFYRSKEVELQRFTLQFVPTLIYSYLSSVAQGNLKSCRCIETLLIGLYNFEVVDETGKPKVVSFRLPSLAQPSIYHEPLSLGPQFLTENALRRWEECNTKLVSWGPLSQVEVINAQNRLKVMSALYFIYNRQLSLLPKLALRHFCIAASRIVTQGFHKKIGCNKSTPRIPVSPNFLLEMIEGAYFAMFNEFYTLALQAVKDIDRRAQYELFPDVMLVTSAVINSLKNNSSGQPCDGPMGISVALSPATTTVTMSKSMITNASFRTKKLPDDIPIQAGQVVPTEATDILTSITEEGESDSTPIQRGGVVRTSKPKLSSFPVLGKKPKDSKDKTVNMADKKVTLKESSKGIWNSLSGGGGDMIDGQPKTSSGDGVADTNGSLKDDKISMSSIQNSTENSDTRSQVTTDSLDIETTPRFAAMQVSSV